MFSLIVTIIAIAIFGTLLSAGISYIDADNVMAKKNAMNAQSAIVNVGMGLTSFRNLMGVEATSPNQLIPAFAHADELPSYISLIDIGNDTYQSQPNSRYSCYLANISNETQALSISRLNNQFKPDTMIFVSDCSQSSEDITLDSTPDSIRFKYYY